MIYLLHEWAPRKSVCPLFQHGGFSVRLEVEVSTSRHRPGKGDRESGKTSAPTTNNFLILTLSLSSERVSFLQQY